MCWLRPSTLGGNNRHSCSQSPFPRPMQSSNEEGTNQQLPHGAVLGGGLGGSHILAALGGGRHLDGEFGSLLKNETLMARCTHQVACRA
jgi:hypothetical protein